MKDNSYLAGGAGIVKNYKIGASMSVAGVIAQSSVVGVINATTTSFADVVGLALNSATYSTTQGDAEGIVRVAIRPDLVIRARMSGSSVAGTSLTTLSNTSADTTGLIVTDADVGTNSSLYGTMWCIGGANVGQSRQIATFNSGADIRCTVPFLNDIAVGDTFLWCPYATFGAAATYISNGNLQATATFIEADGSIAAGTGGAVSVVELILNGAGDSYVDFKLGDHIHGVYTT